MNALKTYQMVFIMVFDRNTGDMLAIGPIMDVCRKLGVDMIELMELLIATKNGWERTCDVDYYVEEMVDAESAIEAAESLNELIEIRR